MINYKFIDDAHKHYEKFGFTRVEVPWTVTKEVADITRPENAKDFQLVHENGKVLVASAEQSFLYQYAKGFLPKGKFMATTPCFRFENITSPAHQKYFIKTELMISGVDYSDRHDTIAVVVNNAMKFFKQYFRDGLLRIVETGEVSCDIYYNDVELGSYGYRSCDFLSYVYGTACAEPRLSSTLEKYRL